MKISSDIVKLYKSVHTWTGVSAALFLFIAFFAGALTVFEKPIDAWATPPSAEVTSLNFDEILPSIETLIVEQPEALARGVSFVLNDDASSVQLQWTQALDNSDHPELQHWQGWYDDEGQLLTRAAHQDTLGHTIDILHQRGGLPESWHWGEFVVGLVCILYSLALISGVILFLPALARDLLAFRIGPNLKRFWLDAHNLVGITSLPFHIIMALTSAVFLLHDPIYEVQDKALYDGQLRSVFRPDAPPYPNASLSAMLAPQELLNIAAKEAPGMKASELQFTRPGHPAAMVRIWGYDPAHMNRGPHGGFLILSPYTGEVLNRDVTPGQAGAGDTALASFFALHFASYGGEPIRWAYLILGLSGAFIFYSGNLLWLESRRKSSRGQAALPDQKWGAHFLAMLTVGVCLGCIVATTMMIASAKWLWPWHAAHAHFFAQCFYIVLLLSVGMAFLLGAARASVALSALAAAACLLIPASSVVALLSHGAVAWVSSEGLWVIDCVGFLAALFFVWATFATHHRAKHGRPDSLWSYSANRWPEKSPSPIRATEAP